MAQNRMDENVLEPFFLTRLDEKAHVFFHPSLWPGDARAQASFYACLRPGDANAELHDTAFYVLGTQEPMFILPPPYGLDM